MNIEQLIPFKVKTCTAEEFREWYMQPMPLLSVGKINLDIVTDKEWTVVGYAYGNFLLVREGEITQWFPSGLCKVTEVPKVQNTEGGRTK